MFVSITHFVHQRALSLFFSCKMYCSLHILIRILSQPSFRDPYHKETNIDRYNVIRCLYFPHCVLTLCSVFSICASSFFDTSRRFLDYEFESFLIQHVSFFVWLLNLRYFHIDLDHVCCICGTQGPLPRHHHSDGGPEDAEEAVVVRGLQHFQR